MDTTLREETAMELQQFRVRLRPRNPRTIAF